MPQLFANNAVTTLAAAITSTSTSLTVQTGDGTLFPNPTATVDFFVVTLESGSNREIIQVQTRSTDSFTDITRAQEGTSAQAWSTGTTLELRLTRDGLTRLHTTREVRRLPAESWVLDQTNPPANGFVGNTPVLDFDASTREIAYTVLPVPPEMDVTTTALFRVTYTVSGSATTAFVIAGNWSAFASGENISSAGTSFSTTLTPNTTADVLSVGTVATITASNFANNDLVSLRLFRDATHASDTHSADWRFVSFEMEYSTRRGAA